MKFEEMKNNTKINLDSDTWEKELDPADLENICGGVIDTVTGLVGSLLGGTQLPVETPSLPQLPVETPTLPVDLPV